MRRGLAVECFVGLCVLAGCAHEPAPPAHRRVAAAGLTAVPPRLVVQIVVDQLRSNIPLMYEHRFGEGGYRVLLDGTWYTHARHPHATTETVVGHTTLATGTYPARHGMIANSWYDRAHDRTQDSVDDPATTLIGTDKPGSSPRMILTTTTSDELRLMTSMRSKVFAVAGKDRAAIPLAGHAGKAYWFTTSTGEFVSSTYYNSTYPTWVTRWNADKAAHVDRYLGKTWALSEPQDRYVYQFNNNIYPKGSLPEAAMEFLVNPAGFGRTFPHTYGREPGTNYYTTLIISPAGDELVIDFATQLLEEEHLGERPDTDYLAIGLSSTDIIGHWFGPMSMESEDNQLRLDRSLARLFAAIDRKVGLQNTLLVLAGDHGMSPAYPETLAELGIVTGTVSADEVKQTAVAAVSAKYPRCAECIRAFHFPNLYLDYPKIAAAGVSRDDVTAVAMAAVSAMPAILLTVPAPDLRVASPTGDPELMTAIRRSWHPTNSGDVYVVQRPGWQINDTPASGEAPSGVDSLLQHGSPWAYDTYVPIAFAGAGVAKQMIHRGVLTVDVAATLAAWLHTALPSGAVGEPLWEVLSN